MARRKQTGIWQAANGMWGVDFRDQERKRHKYLVGPKEAAVNELRTRQKEIYEGRYRPKQPVRMTFAELVKASLESKRGRIAERSYATDVWRTQPVVDAFGPYLIDQITPIMVDSFLSKLRAQGLAGSTCNRYRALLSSHFTYAVRMKLLPDNPVKGVPVFPEAECRRRRLDADEDAALFAAVRRLHPRREPELVLILNCGLRKGGMFNLRWQDVDLDRRQITVHSKGTRYTVELNTLALAALGELHASSGGRSKVFQCKSYSHAFDWLDECVEAAGIEDLTGHDLRHTFGSRAIEAGADLSTVQEWMGHRSILTTRRRYVHLSTEHKLAQIEKLVPNTTRVMDKEKDKSESAVSQVVELTAVNK